ncbi:MAG: ABC transporter permease [Hyphomicrobiales bacterium]|nr:ABC transporter permease [Hyphomicrobiales bacterium]
MTGFVMRRIMMVFPVMGFVALFVFLLLHLGPGDPAAIIAGDHATPEKLAEIRAAHNLDQPIPWQFMTWIAHVLHGDLGTSLLSGLPVTTLIASRLEPTLVLAFLTLAFSTAVALPLGALAACKRDGIIDKLATGYCVLGTSVPFFVVAYFLVLVFAIELRLLPVQGYPDAADGFGNLLLHLVLPVATLSVPVIALVTRTVKTALLDVLSEDHVRTARAKGISEASVIVFHGLRNAALPIVTVLGNIFALLIGGVVVTESIFNLPGIGRLTVDAVLARDYPIVQGIILLAGAAHVLLNLAVDLLYLKFDPRVRYQ